MMDAENCVAKLNQYLQKTSFSEFKYEDVGTDGPDHIKTFTIRVVVNGKAYPEGVGNNKKDAKQKAAKHALKGLLEERENVLEASVGLVQSQDDHVSWIYSYAQKIKMPIKCIESTSKTFQCRFMVGAIEYPVGSGTTKKEAKEEAAKLAYCEIVNGSQTEDENASSTSNQQMEEMRKTTSEICDKTQNLKTEDDGFVEINYIGLINSYCQKKHCTPNFIEVGRSGPPHNPKFSYKLVIDGKDYPVCEGKSIKEAKQNAAQLALSILDGEPCWDSEVKSAPVNSAPKSLDVSPHVLRSLNVGLKSRSPSPSFSRHVSDSSPKVQGKSPDCKPKIKIAANFQNACNQEEGKSAEVKGDYVSRFKEDFDFLEDIGKGGFGKVFKAKHKLEGKNYAVKVVSCEEKSIREVSALSELQHNNIVRYHTCWLEETANQCGNIAHSSFPRCTKNPSRRFLYIQMELCDTKTLRWWLDDMNAKHVEPSQRRQESLPIAQQIVSGVECIHAKKLIHRDLKPANILFGLNGVIKIGDFGLVTVDNDPESLVERSGCKGTRSYMAPEQKTKNTYDRKVDIFALGLIYFELLWRMYTYSEREKLWDDIRNQTLPPEFSHHFLKEDQLIKSMLCLKPEDRPEASQLKTNLEESARALTLDANDRHTV
ncbi:interferon-induced, double-stranded RNA-activated protein kinase [Dunckerocampus dactyliophorus]|uniref:interferon-induced, double-stranded RNA-activated protein kinase n=1 Tax=Dunckerocampus dactyliophorus TaxID=161453 RepID=UPI00240762CE|nr:interferon-induced, double-stranded RNA-activated protein kinase [Dunckerocampus dactyliophorus]